MKKNIFLWCVVLLQGLTTSATAQDRCGYVEYTRQLYDKGKLNEDSRQFEEWLEQKLSVRALRTGGAEKETVYRIPVVVHVVHKGEAIGVGTNLSEEQILSQIKSLNRDFNRQNADTVDSPDEFNAVAGKFNVEFILARQTPGGEATSGIVRVQGAKTRWSTADDAQLKAQSYWPAEDYLNIWVADLSATLLGYAQFPVSSLAGLEDAEDNRLTDGVVVDYVVFGDNNYGPFNLDDSFNNGRTTVHEVGHFFGLRHIWGDDSGQCGGNGDYVSDTPDQGNSTNGCPSHPLATCSTPAMFQNYMDYTDDGCMNIFTEGQVSRMATVIESSIRRASLLESPGLQSADPVENDLGIASVLAPGATQCSNTFAPAIELTNEGTNTVNRVTVKVSLDDDVIETRSFNLALAAGGSAQVFFPPVELETGRYDVAFEILETNDVEDGNSTDNYKSVTALVPGSTSIPFTTDLDAVPGEWLIANPDGADTWAIRAAPRENTSNNALYLNVYGNHDSEGETDVLWTPVFDLAGATSPYLLFDVAYARYQSSREALKVYVLTGCRDTVLVYSKSGSSLATAGATTTSFVPSGLGQWRKEVIDMSAFTGYDRVQVAFEGTNDGGNNLFIDNISLVGQVSEDLVAKQVVDTSPVRCGNEAQPVVLIGNVGGTTVTEFNIAYAVNGGEEDITHVSGISLPPGEQLELTLPQLTLPGEENTLSFTLFDPNGLFDINEADNAIAYTILVNEAADRTPLRQDFNSADFTDQWTILNPYGGAAWQAAGTNYGQSVFFDAYNNDDLGAEAWLVSPVLDLSGAPAASVFFDYSYRLRTVAGGRDPAADILKVLASGDCGNTFNEVLLEEEEGSLSAVDQASAWAPGKDGDWIRPYISLASLAGGQQVRLAFVFTNGNGNNLYLDNIEFYASDDPAPFNSAGPYTVYGAGDQLYITFNLKERQPVYYELIDVMGRQLVKQALSDVLNQTYPIRAEVSQGMYIVRLKINDRYYATKLYAGS